MWEKEAGQGGKGMTRWSGVWLFYREVRKVSLIRNLCTFETCAQYIHIYVYSFEPEEIQEKNIYVEVKIQTGAATVENSMEVPQKVKNRTILQSSNHTTEYLPKEYKQ